MDPVTWTFLILALAIVAFVSGRIPLVLVSFGVILSLWATGVLSLTEALAGFGDPTVVFIATLFVISESLDATGVTAWVGRAVIARAGPRPGVLIVIVGTLVAVLTGLISLNGAVAALLPVVVVVAVRAGIVPSKLLLPLAFVASAGGLLTLAGSPANPVVSDFAAQNGGQTFGFFEFALVGLPLVVLSILFFATIGQRLVPERSADRIELSDPSVAAQRWREGYDVDLPTSSLFTNREGVVEVLIAPRSSLIGRRVSPGMTTREENLVILAVRPGAADEPSGTAGQVPPEGLLAVTLRAGDAVLVQGAWPALERYTRSPDVIAVTPPHAMERALPLHSGARRALAILAGTVILLATGIVPPAVAGLLAVGALIVTRVLGPEQTYRAIDWTTVILVAGMMPLSAAFTSTGAADVVAEIVLGFTGGTSPAFALLVVCVLTIVLTQFIANVTAVLLVAPIAAAVSATMDVSIQPFMMGLAVASAASFLTPIATPVNMMVMQPAGLRFADYWKPGLPLTLLFLAAAVLYVPLVWPF